MSADEGSVNVLVLGGMTHIARPLLTYLIPPPTATSSAPALAPGPKVAHVRIVDKFLVANEGSTTYIDPPTQAALKDARVEYRQANLAVQETIQSAFDLPDGVPSNTDGGSYDFVFDFTGEGVVGSDHPEQLLKDRTAQVASSLAREAGRRKVRAYVRSIPPVFDSDSKETGVKEEDLGKKGPKARNAKTYWWYESMRGVANVPGLNLVIARCAELWGPHIYTGSVCPRIACGAIYRYMNEEMKLLWGDDLRTHTVHASDAAAAHWALARWIARLGRAQADDVAGEPLPPIKLKDKLQAKEREVDFDGLCPRNVVPRAPVFNVVDDEDSTQGTLAEAIGQTFKIRTGFHGPVINQFAKLNLESVVDDVNEKHIEAGAKLFNSAPVPITYSPITFYLDEDQLGPRSVALDGHKIQQIVGWKPTTKVDVAGFKDVVRSFMDAGVWPKYESDEEWLEA